VVVVLIEAMCLICSGVCKYPGQSCKSGSGRGGSQECWALGENPFATTLLVSTQHSHGMSWVLLTIQNAIYLPLPVVLKEGEHSPQCQWAWKS